MSETNGQPEKPLYQSISGVRPEEIAGALNGLYKDGYHLKELIPERIASPFPDNQRYTILVVGDPR